ncbi:MAG: hypothetical protein EOM64_02055 [Erysipelotrichia bacterium]|nr:hypothetical protein [Erysipelotrichia bacterium]
MAEHSTLATEVVEKLGGTDNIAEFENCMTRLRVIVKDPTKVNREALGKIKGVMRVVGTDSEPQIVVGPGVADTVSSEVKNMAGIKYSEQKDHSMMKKQSAKGILNFFSQVFVPLIPVFAGSGLIFGIMKIFTLIFNMTGFALFDPATSQFMFALNVLASTFFTYLNIAVAMQAAKVMGGNPYLGLVAGGIIINLGSLAGTDMGIFGLKFTNGRGGTLAALAAGALIAWLEIRIKKHTPDALKIHMPSLLAIIITGLVTLYVLQPIGGLITDGVTSAFLWMIDTIGFLAYGIIAFGFLPLVMTGMHQGLNPIHTSLIESLGYTLLYSCCSMAGGGQVGSSLALMAKYKNNKGLKRAIIGGLPAGILGIGEPLIFGVSLPLGRVFFEACAGAFFGGCVLGLFSGQGAVTLNVSGILGTLVNTNPLAYILAYAVSVGAGFIITYIGGADKEALDDFEATTAD